MSSNKKIVSLLKRKKLKISFAESCTGGMLSSAFTSVSGSSKVFTLGLVTYSNQAKTGLLKVPQKIIKKYGAVSVQCCLDMVDNLSKISKSKVCASITGIAGPKGGSKQKPVGLVYIGIKVGKKVVVNKCNFKNKGRIFIQKQTVKKTLNLLAQLIKQDS
ncbi:MAG: CinA family protein [Pseudomonadota bacterium]|nr:CinA family protein [Pseudomonadota bacterium]